MTCTIDMKKLSWQESLNPKINTKNIKTPGRWVAYIPISYADNVWKKIDLAMKNGFIGYRAKISSPIFYTEHKRPVCCVLYIYTYDCNDLIDARRVREELRKLGFTHPIKYQSKEILIL